MLIEPRLGLEWLAVFDRAGVGGRLFCVGLGGEPGSDGDEFSLGCVQVLLVLWVRSRMSFRVGPLMGRRSSVRGVESLLGQLRGCSMRRSDSVGLGLTEQPLVLSLSSSSSSLGGLVPLVFVGVREVSGLVFRRLRDFRHVRSVCVSRCSLSVVRKSHVHDVSVSCYACLFHASGDLARKSGFVKFGRVDATVTEWCWRLGSTCRPLVSRGGSAGRRHQDRRHRSGVGSRPVRGCEVDTERGVGLGTLPTGALREFGHAMTRASG